MDSYREHPSDLDITTATDIPPPCDTVAEIGTDERRMHVRAYNYWVSLLQGRDFPSIEDLEPADLKNFASNSVLLDFTCARDNPAIPYVGTAIRDACGLSDDVRTIEDVPSRSLLSRLTDHYLQIIANRAPIGFEAEFQKPTGETICYRGILMPFSSDGDTIDFIYGVINWKHVDDAAGSSTSEDAAPPQALPELQPSTHRESADDEVLELDQPLVADEVAQPAPHVREMVEASAHFSWEDGPLAGSETHSEELPQFALHENAALADRLWAARETADAARSAEGRTRAALYRALSLAYDFALAANASPKDYAELLEESGMKVQARAPMTAIVKLVFGIDYDKARLTEFAAALCYAQRQQLGQGEFEHFISNHPGGLKGMVAAERSARRPDAKADTKGELARARLRSAPSISLADVPAAEEFAVVVTRRGPNGRHEAVAIVENEALVERAIRHAA